MYPLGGNYNSDRCVKCGHQKLSFAFVNPEYYREISKSMGVNTKASKKLEFKGHWILVDGNISDEDFKELTEILNESTKPKP